MAKIERSLEQLFRDNADTKSIYECDNMITNIQSMTEERFVKVVVDLLTECYSNQANSESDNFAMFNTNKEI